MPVAQIVLTVIVGGDFAKYAKSIIFGTKHFVYLLPRIMQSAVIVLI
jgi:hypothetical protein